MRVRGRNLVWGAALMLGGCSMNLRPGASNLQEAFQEVGSTPAEQVAMARNKYDANERYLGTLGLANQNFAGEPVYIAMFEDHIKDPDPMVRAAAIRGLANHGEPRHVAVIAKCLSEENPLVRAEAARGLQRLHDPAGIDPLIVATREPDPTTRSIQAEPEAAIRAEAATALAQYPEAKVLRALIAALDDTDLAVNKAAQASLRTLTGQDFGIDRIAWQSWMDGVKEPFAGRQLFVYPVYSRKTRLYEYIPLVPKPPNEVAGMPVGMPR